MIPTFEKFLYPFILALKDKDINKKQMVEEMREYFHLSDKDMNVRTKSGSTTQILDRTGWALQYLRRALFVEIKDGKYHITDRGVDFLKSHNDLVINDLLDYQEFAEYSNRKKTKPTEAQPIVVPSVQELTPTEQLEQAYDSIEKDLAADLLSKVLGQTPAFFENLVVDLLVKMGYGGSFKDSSKVTPYVHDNGVDGIIYEDKLGLDKICIQAKRYTSGSVGAPEVRAFYGALGEQKASKGVFITTSSYSTDAKNFVEKSDKKIVLIDGQALAKYMIEYNVGVSTKTVYEVKKIDNDYFDE